MTLNKLFCLPDKAPLIARCSGGKDSLHGAENKAPLIARCSGGKDSLHGAEKKALL